MTDGIKETKEILIQLHNKLQVIKRDEETKRLNLEDEVCKTFEKAHSALELMQKNIFSQIAENWKKKNTFLEERYINPVEKFLDDLSFLQIPLGNYQPKERDVNKGKKVKQAKEKENQKK